MSIKVIDCHTHFFPEKIAHGAMDKMREGGNVTSYCDGTFNCLITAMESCNVDQAIALPVATNPAKVCHMNDGFTEFIQKATGNAIIQFGCMHPDCPTWREELHRLSREGFIGFKIHPVYNGVDIDDDRFLRILDLAGEVGLFVVTHAGYDIGFPDRTNADVEKIRHAIDVVGDVPIVCAHMGGWKQWDKVKECLASTKVCFDTSFSTGTYRPLHDNVSEAQKRMLGKEEFVSIIRAIGVDRFMFGSDSPWSDQRESIEFIQKSGLDEVEQEAIFHQNAEQIFGI